MRILAAHRDIEMHRAMRWEFRHAGSTWKGTSWLAPVLKTEGEKESIKANPGNDYPDDQPQPIDTDAPSTSRRLTSNSTVAERWSANRKHHEELISHTLDAATYYGGHGHAVGEQGAPRPHDGSERPCGAGQGRLHSAGRFQNRQNTSSDGEGSASANDPSTKNYGVVDSGKK